MGAIKRRMLVNAVFAGLPFLVHVVVGIFLARFLLTRLGGEVYGLIPLVNAVVVLLTMLSMGIYAALGRYVTYHLARGEIDTANEYLNTGQELLVKLAAVGGIALILLVAFLPHLFHLPEAYDAEARVVMLLLGLTCLADMAASPLGVPLYSTQRLALRYSLDIANALIRTALIVAAFVCIRAQVGYVALATLVTSLLIHFVHLGLSRLLVPSLHFSRRFFRKELVRNIFQFSSYMIIIHIGVLIFVKTDILLVNWLMERPGTPAVAMYSFAARWNPEIRSVLWTILAVVTPVITALEAAGDFHKIREAIVRGTRYALLLAALPCLLFPLFAREFLQTWLKDAFTADRYAEMTQILATLVVPILFMAGSAPITVALRGMGRIRVVALVIFGAAVANIGLSIFLATVGGMGMLGIAVASSLCSVAQDVVIYPVYGSRVLGFQLGDYFAGYVRPLIAFVPTAIVAGWIRFHYGSLLVGWGQVLTAYAICSLVFLLCGYFIGLRKDDRQMLWETVGLANRA